MINNKYKVLRFICLFVMSTPIYATDGVHLDQDVFAPGNEDRNYTMGLSLDWYGNKALEHRLSTHRLLESLNKRLGVDHAEKHETNQSYTIGISAFTPDDLSETKPIFDDRPYSSILYATSRVIGHGEEGIALGSRLTVGILGLPIAEWGQTEIHKIGRQLTGKETPVDPLGWDNQISNGGELTAKYKRSIYRRVPSKYNWFDAAISGDFSVGYYTNVSFGGALRIGKLNKSVGDPFWNIIDGMNPQSDASGLIAENTNKWYLSIGVRQTLVAYNGLLQCQFRSSKHCLSSSDIDRTVSEVSLGFTYQNSKSTWSATCNRRSAEHQLAQQRGHNWCGINWASN